MSFQFDATGVITLSGDIVLDLDYLIVMPTFTIDVPEHGAQAFLGNSGQGQAVIYFATSTEIRIVVGGNNRSFTIPELPVNTPISGMTFRREGSAQILTYDGVEYTATSLGTLRFNEFSTYSSQLSGRPFEGTATGLLEFYTDASDNSGEPTYVFDFDDSSDPSLLQGSGTITGAVTGFTTGGFEGVEIGEGALTISTPVTGDIQRMNAGFYSKYLVTGTMTNLLSSGILKYKVDNGESQFFANLDLDFDNNTFSGEVLIPNGSHDITVVFASDENVSATVTGVRAALSVLAWGQSNTEGQGDNNQPLTLETGAQTPLHVNYRNGSLATLADPTSGNTGGSVLPRLSSLIANSGLLVVMSNCAENSVSTTRWLKSEADLYPRTEVAAELLGGYDIAFCIIGESDVNDTAENIRTRMESISIDLKADYGCDNYICFVPRSELDVFDSQNNAYADVIEARDFIKFGGNLNVIDVTDEGGDGTHLIQDAELKEAAEIIYAALREQRNTGVHVSKAVMTLTGADGDIPTRVINLDTERDAFIGEVTWSNGSATQKVFAKVGANIQYSAVDSSSGYGLQVGVTTA